MVGADEEMSVTVVRWKLGEERLKKDLEEGAAAAEPEGTPEGEVKGKEGIDAEIKRDILELKKEIKFGKSQGEPEVKNESPDFLKLMLERTIDTILLEEVASLGTKMNRYRNVLAQGIFTLLKSTRRTKQTLPAWSKVSDKGGKSTG